MIDTNPHDLYLLCYIDLPWEADPLREDPQDRERLFNLYESELQSRDLNYGIVRGKGSKRLQNAINIVDKFAVNFPDNTVN